MLHSAWCSAYELLRLQSPLSERSVERKKKKKAAVFPSGAMDQVLAVLLGTSERTLNRPWHDLTARCPTCVTCSGRSLSGGPSDSPLLLQPPWVCCWRSQADLGGKAEFFGLRCRGRARRSGSACLSMPAVPSVACSGTTAGKRSGRQHLPLSAGLTWEEALPPSDLEAGFL